jgi:exoribonuclease II
VQISERRRGSPLDKLVAELMIVANSTWGGLLAEKKVACIYRAQVGGRVRMTTSPLPHEGLGVAQYAWCTSPLRRYTDLVNQWQLVALLRGESPAFSQRSELLFAAMRDFDLTYTAYAEFQRGMERYWCLRWLEQNGVRETTGRTLRREGMVKVDHLPLAVACPSIPAGLAAGTHVRLSVGDRNELALDASLRFIEVMGDAIEVEDEPEELPVETEVDPVPASADAAAIPAAAPVTEVSAE